MAETNTVKSTMPKVAPPKSGSMPFGGKSAKVEPKEPARTTPSTKPSTSAAQAKAPEPKPKESPTPEKAGIKSLKTLGYCPPDDKCTTCENYEAASGMCKLANDYVAGDGTCSVGYKMNKMFTEDVVKSAGAKIPGMTTDEEAEGEDEEEDVEADDDEEEEE